MGEELTEEELDILTEGRTKLLEERQKIYESEMELWTLLDGMSTEMLREIIEKAITELVKRINKKENF